MNDPLTTGVLASTIANGLTTIASYLWRHEEDRPLSKQRDLFEVVARDASLISILQKASTDVARGLTGANDAVIEKVKFFMTSPDVDGIVRQMYATQLARDRGTESVKKLKAEFLACLDLHIGGTADTLKFDARKLFDALVLACDRALEVAIAKGYLAAHEAKSAARSRLIMDELAAIKANLKFFSGRAQPDVAEVEQYEAELRSQVAARYAYIVPPHFDARRRIPIDDLYVIPRFAVLSRTGRGHEESETCSLSNLMAFLFRGVVLGNPGSGKSTLANKICHDLAVSYSTRPLGGRRVTPILVVLRDYGKAKKEKGASILQFIENLSTSTHQLAPPKNSLEYLLRNGRLFIIFDGLDELLDTSYRQEVSEDVESFCSLYPSVPVLVTSREVGYEQAPLSEKHFEALRIAPFDDDQVEEYVNKWFAADQDLSSDQQKEKAETFLNESRVVPDLRANPLMLALICNIYRGENYIPRNRPDVYEKCAIMLFEKWDKARGIQISLPFEAHIRPAMMYLAHWIYSDETLQGGVTEDALITKSTEYLCPRRYEDRDEARQAAIAFIGFCSGRAWVFTDTGTTKGGERLYQFTHRTFLEYFTASHLVRMNPTPNALAKVLIPRISSREWDVVAQLACQLQNKQVDGAGDELLEKILKWAVSSRRGVNTRGNLLSFAARSLQFLVPSPAVVRQISHQSFEFAIKLGCERLSRTASMGKKWHKPPVHRQPDETLAGILSATHENRKPVTQQLLTELEGSLESSDHDRAILSLQIILNLSSFLYTVAPYGEVDPDLEEYWSTLGKSVLERYQERVYSLSKLDLATALFANLKYNVGISRLVEWHGIRSLFYSAFLPVSESIFIQRFIPDMVLNSLRTHRGSKAWRQWFARIQRQQDEIANILVSTKPPWLTRKDAEQFQFRSLDSRYHGLTLRRRLRLKKESTLFLLFISVAVSCEAASDKSKLVKQFLKKAPYSYSQSFRFAVLARLGQANDEKVAEEITQHPLLEEHKEIIRRWVSGEVSFLE